MSMHQGTAGPAVALVRFDPLASARSIVGRLLIGAGAMLRAALAGRSRRRTARMLASLSDAALRDIGIRRSEIRAVTDALMAGATVQGRTEH